MNEQVTSNTAADPQPNPEYKKIFFLLCKDLYTEEYQRTETINQRAVHLIALFSAVCGALYIVPSFDAAKGAAPHPAIAYFIGICVSWVSTVIGIVFLFLTIFPKRTRNPATLDQWNSWIKEQEGQQPPSIIETGLYNHMSESLAKGQSARFRSNERCFAFLKGAKICLAIALFSLLIAVGSQFAMHLPINKKENPMTRPIESSAPSPPAPLPPDDTVKTADDKKK